jgi:hypothetical protein
MKMIAAVPLALLTLGLLGCSQQASTASTPAVQHAPGSSETNTFGESKEAATGSAASARAASYGADPAPAADPAPSSGSTAESTPPK